MPQSKGLRRFLEIALPLGAALATLMAVVVVVALFWWAQSLPAPDVSRPSVASAPVQRPVPAPPAQASAANVAAVAAPPPAAPKAPAAAAAPPADALVENAPPATEAQRGSNPDAAKNRGIGNALSALGADPEMQRRLALPKQ